MLYEKVVELQNAAGANAKCAVLQRYEGDEEFERFLYYALNPFITYNLSEKTLRLEPAQSTPSSMFADIFECCTYLSLLRGIDNATVNQVRCFLSEQNENDRELFIKMLSKTLRLGVTAKTVNKVFGDMIPVWEVQQAYPIDKYPIKDGTEFWLTQKLNGVRATYYKGQLIARSGTKYEGLEHIIRCIQENVCAKLGLWDIVLDGELTLFDNKGLSDNEAFRMATGIINSDGDDKSEIGFTVFDALYDTTQFSGDDKQFTYSSRRRLLSQVQQHMPNGMPVRVLPVLYHGTDQGMIDKLLNRMVAEDKEGLMLNLDVPYKRTRHKGILKVKRFYTMDLPIVRCEEGEGRLAGTLGSLVVMFDGNEVNVGTGFSDDQREAIWMCRDILEGMICEVKYKEVSYDKNTGLRSLQFPVFVQIRKDKTEPSYG